MNPDNWKERWSRVRSWLSRLEENVLASIPEKIFTFGFLISLPGRIVRLVSRTLAAIARFVWRLITGVLKWLSQFLEWKMRRALRLAGVGAVLSFIGIWAALWFATYYPSSQVAT